MNNLGLLNRNKTAFMVIDIQERLIPVINNKEELFKNTNYLIKGAEILSIPLSARPIKYMKLLLEMLPNV